MTAQPFTKGSLEDAFVSLDCNRFWNQRSLGQFSSFWLRGKSWRCRWGWLAPAIGPLLKNQSPEVSWSTWANALQSANWSQPTWAAHFVVINSICPRWTGYLFKITAWSCSKRATSSRVSHGWNGLGFGPSLFKCLGRWLWSVLNWKLFSGLLIRFSNHVLRGINAPVLNALSLCSRARFQ